MKKHYFLIIIVFLFACKEKEFSQIIVAYPKDSINNISLCINENLIQEWTYSLNWYNSKNDKYSEYNSNSDLMDSLKSIVSRITEIRKGQAYRIVDNSNKIIFVFSIDLLKNNELKNLLEDKPLNKDYLLLLEFMKRQKYSPIKTENEDSNDSIYPSKVTPPPRIVLTK